MPSRRVAQESPNGTPADLPAARHGHTPGGLDVPGAHEAPGRQGIRLALILVAAFMVVLDFSIVNVALPSIERELALRADTVQWVVTGYAIAFGGLPLSSAAGPPTRLRQAPHVRDRPHHVLAGQLLAGGPSRRTRRCSSPRVSSRVRAPRSSPRPRYPSSPLASLKGQKRTRARSACTDRSPRWASSPARCSAAC